MTKRFTVSLDLLESIKVTVFPKEGVGTGLQNEVKLVDIPPKVLAMALEQGFWKALTDVSLPTDDKATGPGADRANESALHALRDKRARCWYLGEWANRGGERGETAMTFLREHFYYECLTDQGLARSKVDKLIKDTVAEVFGADEKATFGKFLDAMAQQSVDEGEDWEEVREEIESGLLERATKAQAERDKAAAGVKVDLAGILVRRKGEA